jgi:RNA recognition motif-containing protein
MPITKLYVGNLDATVTDELLRELFEKRGDVRSVRIFEEKGFAFVEMFTHGDAMRARDSLNGTQFMGRYLKVGEARNSGRDRRYR